jgi:23S rRNA (adenine2503-C2)-methyltransferase
MNVNKVVSIDGTRKYSFDLGKGLRMEAAFFKVAGRERPYIACVSTQLGCAVGCPFCATAHTPFFRNLTKEEILLQIGSILDDQQAEMLFAEGFEVSFMGMGEPLANLRALLTVIHEIHSRYPKITRVSVSTSGPATRIDSLIHEMPVLPSIHLQISLHATNDSTRRRLIPNAPDSIENLLGAGRRFHERTGDQVYLNYVLLKGINDSAQDARWLAQLDHKVFMVKIAALNQTTGMPSEMVGASMDEILAFSLQLQEYKLPHRVFVGDGLDVDASCGQLAAVPRELHA